MHVIISLQQVIFTCLISFYKCFNNMYFTYVILLSGSNAGRYSGYQRTTLLSFSFFYFLFIIIIIIGGGAVGFVFLTFLIFKAY